MARKRSKKRSSGTARSETARVKSVITSRRGKRGEDWGQVGPIWVQQGPFGETPPFVQTISDKRSEREKRIRRFNERALRLLARARRAKKRKARRS
jgi:hypothetical protein